MKKTKVKKTDKKITKKRSVSKTFPSEKKIKEAQNTILGMYED